VIVLDASAVVDVVTRRSEPDLARRVLRERRHAPHLVDIEVTHALRGMVRRGELSGERASDARLDATELAITRYAHRPLLVRAWQLRDYLSIYDAVYVALAELLDAPLVTCDARLAASTGHDATIELFA
jgi:predicted nucleic acid-binding protein